MRTSDGNPRAASPTPQRRGATAPVPTWGTVGSTPPARTRVGNPYVASPTSSPRFRRGAGGEAGGAPSSPPTPARPSPSQTPPRPSASPQSSQAEEGGEELLDGPVELTASFRKFVDDYFDKKAVHIGNLRSSCDEHGPYEYVQVNCRQCETEDGGECGRPVCQ